MEGKRTDRSQQEDPCAGISQQIDETQKRINEDKAELQLKRDLTPEQKKEIEQDLEDRQADLRRLESELKRCEEHKKGKRD